MVIDFRAYTLRPGTVPLFTEMFEKVGLPIQDRILGKEAFLGFYRTEIGDIYEIIHLWRYADANERATKRALLYKDLEFIDYVAKMREMMVSANVRLMLDSPFNPTVLRR